jgi:ATP-dependent Lhr-like helicase
MLPARVDGYRPALLDELCASGEVAWVGRGALGRSDGRVALVNRASLPSLSAPVDAPSEALHQAIVQCLQSRGASFFVDILAATGEPAGATLDALWDLAWAGQVTNDTLVPLRAIAWPKRSTRPGRGRGSVFPPEAGGRWSLVATSPEKPPAPTVLLHGLAEQLLERYGVVTRETVAAEVIPGGFAALYPVFKALEETGRARRGYFIEGLGASQFAIPGAVDRLRSHRDPDPDAPLVVLSATDPANPYGATCPWPAHDAVERRALQRAAGAYLVLQAGRPAAYLAGNGKSVTLFALDDGPELQDVARALQALAPRLPRQTLTIESIDEVPAMQSPYAAVFTSAGFQPGYRGLVYRAMPFRA